MKNILDLNAQDAKAFFTKEESYINFDLPPYFKFTPLLNNLSLLFDSIELNDNDLNNVNNEENVNYKLLNSKGGKYGWRPLQIIHPVLYLFLVSTTTNEDNWKYIKERFGYFNNNSNTDCMSIPVLSTSERSDKAEQILSWWEKVEQKSLSFGLDFEYFFEVDIANCYGSIYTHSIAWALHDKNVAKANHGHSLVGNVIDKNLRRMSNGQTNGIPQGSIIMDFIAEMVLGYADVLLTQKIDHIKDDYKIIRYRDDYRVFVNNPNTGERILKHLSEVLSELSMQFNTQKIHQSHNIIQHSIKPDKLYNIVSGKDGENIQQELLIAFSISQKFPNSGTVDKKLRQIFNTIKDKKSIKNYNVLVSIIVNIALKCPKSYPIITAILSRLISSASKEEKDVIINKILKKFRQIPNTGHLHIWLQRMSIKINREQDYAETLCKKVKNIKEDINIWNSDWISSTDVKNALNFAFVDETEIFELDTVISAKEVELFKEYNS